MKTDVKLPDIVTWRYPPSSITCVCGEMHVVGICETTKGRERQEVLEQSAHVLGWVEISTCWRCPRCWASDIRMALMEKSAGQSSRWWAVETAVNLRVRRLALRAA